MISVANLILWLIKEKVSCNADATYPPQVLSDYRVLLQDLMNLASSDHECLGQDMTLIITSLTSSYPLTYALASLIYSTFPYLPLSRHLTPTHTPSTLTCTSVSQLVPVAVLSPVRMLFSPMTLPEVSRSSVFFSTSLSLVRE